MPIAKDIKHHYPDNWDELREQVLERAANRSRTEHGHPMPGHGGACCEWCGRPDGVEVPVRLGGMWEWMHENEDGCVIVEKRTKEGEIVEWFNLDREREPDGWGEYSSLTTTVLTVAHLDQDPRGDDTDRLRAVCQRCHLTYDRQPEQKARRERLYAELRGQGVLL